MRRVYPDTNVLIYVVENKPLLADRLRIMLHPEQAETPVLVFSELTRMECRVSPLRAGDMVALAAYDQLFSNPLYEFTPLRRDTFEAATALRAEYGLKTPDALHLAAALQAGCDELWTNDQRLAQAAQGRLHIVNLLATSTSG